MISLKLIVKEPTENIVSISNKSRTENNRQRTTAEDNLEV
jgi:hypothetical protein